jgi:hypothetical protein
MTACRWINDPTLEGGGFLVPGCWNRALNGIDAECHCKTDAPPSLQDQVDSLRAEIERLKNGVTP